MNRHTSKTEKFGNFLVVVTGFGQPSDATRKFFIFKYGKF